MRLREPGGTIPALTGFRALAAAMVFVGHAEASREVGGAWLLRYGWTGVNLFFALSGFLFTVLYLDRIGTSAFSLGDYLKKRAFRVLPLTWLLTAIAFVTWPSFAWGDVVAHLLLVHAFFPNYRFSIDPPMWTLSVEESFYLAVPLLLPLVRAAEQAAGARTVRGVVAVAALLFLFTEAGVALTSQLIEVQYLVAGVWDSSHWVMTLTGRFSDFACGILAGVVALRTPPRGALAGAVLAGLGLATWFFAAAWTERHGGPVEAGRVVGYQVVARLFSAGGALFVLALVGDGPLARLFGAAPVVYAGRISFALYLVQDLWVRHLNVSAYVSRFVRRFVAHEPLVVVAMYALTSAIAAALHHGVEDPAQRWLRARFLRHERPALER